MALRPYRNEELNYFKFSSLVLNEFPKALRQTFKTMWDNTFGHRPGFQLWDDSLAVRNLFVSAEGGATSVPTHQSYNEWDCSALFQATIFAQAFALPDSSGRRRTLSDLYVKPRGVPRGSFHSSVVSPSGNNAETFALAIDQLRLLRNSLCHSATSEMDKITFDQCVRHAKDAFKALGATTAVIDAVGSLTETDFPTNEVQKLEQRMREEFKAYIKFLEAMSSDISELTVLSTAIKRRVESNIPEKEDIAMLEQKLEELIKAKNEVDERDTRANEILENVSSDINELRSNSAAIKQKMESDVPNKEDIAILGQKIDAQGTKVLEDMNSAMDELKQKLEGETASKEDIAMLEGKIDELKVAQDVADDQSKNPGMNKSLPRSFLPLLVPNFTGRQSECQEIIKHVTSESARIVSIWGSPGFGKTSVAIAVGRELQTQGLPVCFLSLRSLRSVADLKSKLLRAFRQFTTNHQSSALAPEDELYQRVSEISERIVVILDNADDLLESGLPNVKTDVVRLLEEILWQNETLTLVVTTRESFEFMSLHFRSHKSLRVGPLDEASSKALVHKLLPTACTSDCNRVTQVCGHVPLAIKILCSLIGEDTSQTSQFLPDFMGVDSESIAEVLDNPDYPTDHRLQFLFDSSFQRLSVQEKEALVSLSILPENFSTEVAEAVLGETRIFEAKKILQRLCRKSLIDLSSKTGSFSMHKLLQSFAREKGEHGMKDIIQNSKRRFCEFYVSRFQKLNEQFLTGHSMSAFIAFYEDDQSIVQSLLDGCSHS